MTLQLQQLLLLGMAHTYLSYQSHLNKESRKQPLDLQGAQHKDMSMRKSHLNSLLAFRPQLQYHSLPDDCLAIMADVGHSDSGHIIVLFALIAPIVINKLP